MTQKTLIISIVAVIIILIIYANWAKIRSWFSSATGPLYTTPQTQRIGYVTFNNVTPIIQPVQGIKASGGTGII